MPQQANADQTGIAEGLKNRIQQSAAIAAMRDNEEHPPSTPTPSPYASTPLDKVAHQRPAPKGEKDMYKQAVEWSSGLKKYHKGVASVPETGPAILKKGEKVVPAEKNPDNPDNKGDHMSEHSPEEKAHFSRAMHKLHGGALHRHFGIPEGEPIPMAKKEEAANSSNPHVAAMGRMAKAMAGWKH